MQPLMKGQCGGDSELVLYVGNLDPRLGEEDLKTILDPFGIIESVALNRDEVTRVSKGFAFVKFRNPEDCRTAHDKINATGLELCGKVLRVGFAGFPTGTGSSQRRPPPSAASG